MQNAINIIKSFALSGQYKSDAANVLKFFAPEYNPKANPEILARRAEVFNTLIPAEVAQKMTDQKVTKRVLRMVAMIDEALNSKGEITDTYLEKNAAIASAIMLTATTSSIEQTQARFVAGISKECDSDRTIKGVSKAKINRFVGLGGRAGTVSAQISTMFKDKGIFSLLGVLQVVGKGKVEIDLAKRDACAFLQAYGVALDKVRDSDFSKLQTA